MIFTIASDRTLRDSLEHKVALTPEKTYLVFDNDGETSSFTYHAFDSQVNKVANALLELGVQKGDKVNLHLTNCPEFVIFWFACAKVGAVIMPTNPLSPAGELSYPMQHSESILLFRLGDFYEAFDEDAEKLSRSLDIVLTSSEMGKGQ